MTRFYVYSALMHTTREGLDIKGDERGTTVAIELAFRTRAPGATVSILGREVSCQVDVGQLPVTVKMKVWPFQRHKREGGAVAVVDSVRVRFDSPRDYMPAQTI